MTSLISFSSTSLSILFVINFIVACFIIFLERKDPSSTLAWIMVLFLVPFVGILFYVLFSQTIYRKKIFRFKLSESRIYEASLEDQINSFKNNNFIFSQPEMSLYKDMIHLHQVHSKAFFSQDNRIEIFSDGHAKFDSLLDDIHHAKTSIHMLYFIFEKDDLGEKIIEALTQKAKEGLEVRLLLDAVGSRKWNQRTLRKFTDAGGKSAFFFPNAFKLFNLKMNYRNHRKLVIIDSRIGYLGGFNVGDAYLGLSSKMGYWRDTHLRILGSAVYELQTRFILDWRSASKDELDMSMSYFPEIRSDGDAGAQIVSCGPDSVHEQIKQGYVKMISSAKKSILIQTPYFVPDESIQESLKIAALSGVDVKIMIPDKPDHIFVYWATYSYVGELIKAGAKIFTYENGFLHSKVIIVDDNISSVGTANFDIRSFRLNFEVNAFIYDAATTEKLTNLFKKDLYYCSELDQKKYDNRSSYIKFKESISRLVSPLL